MLNRRRGKNFLGFLSEIILSRVEKWDIIFSNICIESIDIVEFLRKTRMENQYQLKYNELYSTGPFLIPIIMSHSSYQMNRLE